MPTDLKVTDWVDLLDRLTRAPVVGTDKSTALREILVALRRTLRSQACALTFVDLENRTLSYGALDGFGAVFEGRLLGKTFRLGPSQDGNWLDFAAFAESQVTARKHLDVDGAGVANPSVARQLGLRSVLAAPMIAEGKLIGHLCHFSSEVEDFGSTERKLLAAFAHQAVLTIQRFDFESTLNRAITIFRELSVVQTQQPARQFLAVLPDLANNLLGTSSVVLWILNEAGSLEVMSTSEPPDSPFSSLCLDPHTVPHLLTSKVSSLKDVTRPSRYYLHAAQAKQRGFRSLLTSPLRVRDKLIGMVDVYSNNLRDFREWEKRLFGAFADQIAVAVLPLASHHKPQILRQFAAPQVAFSGPGSEVDEIVAELAVTLCKLDGVAATLVALKSPTDGSLSAAAWFTGASGLQDTKALDAQLINDSILGKVAALGLPYIGKPPEQLQWLPSARNLIAVPIVTASGVSGAVGIAGLSSDPSPAHLLNDVQRFVAELPTVIELASTRDALRDWAGLISAEQTAEWFLTEILSRFQRWLHVRHCIFWRFNRNSESLEPILSQPFDDFLGSRAAVSVHDSLVSRIIDGAEPVHHVRFAPSVDVLSEACAPKEWRSWLTAPVFQLDAVCGKYLLGILQAYSTEPDLSTQRRTLRTVSSLVSVGYRNLRRRGKRLHLADLLKRIGEARNEDDLLTHIADGASALLDCLHTCVGTIDRQTGRLRLIFSEGLNAPQVRELKHGSGLTGQAISCKTSILATDIAVHPWSDHYSQIWADTKSELVVPMIVTDRQWQDDRPIPSQRVIGVINAELPVSSGFGLFDREVVEALAGPAALNLYRVQTEAKLAGLRSAEQSLIGVRDEDEIIRILSNAIVDTIGFEHVNISMVDSSARRITSRFVQSVHIPIHEQETFKKAVNFALDDPDIQSWVVKNRGPVVPGEHDPRFNQKIHRRHGLDKLVRVYMAMIVSAEGRVIGTVEAGYRRSIRPVIFDQDVQILKGFIDYATAALDQVKKSQITKIGHELTSPIGGIQNNTAFLLDNWAGLPPDKITRKLEDILADCGTALLQVGTLKHLFGSRAPGIRWQRVLVVRDIVIKTINQMVPEFRAKGIDVTRQIKYDRGDSRRIAIWTDRARLGQVVANLVGNAIKYSGRRLRDYELCVSVREDSKAYYISFSETGIGVEPGYEGKIFDDGVRAPNAIAENVAGSGVGLTIARSIMRELGGDLALARPRKPTIFELIFPKALKEKPRDRINGR